MTIPINYNTLNHCIYSGDGLCHQNYEYNTSNACTYAFGNCYPDGTT